MILARLVPEFDAFVSRLAARAKAVAEAQTATAQAECQGDPLRWRKASLLWPLFTKD